jgi:hypothetical protein
MARVVDHVSVAELEGRYEASEGVTSSRHFQAIFLLAKGHSSGGLPVRSLRARNQSWIAAWPFVRL